MYHVPYVLFLSSYNFLRNKVEKKFQKRQDADYTNL